MAKKKKDNEEIEDIEDDIEDSADEQEQEEQDTEEKDDKEEKKSEESDPEEEAAATEDDEDSEERKEEVDQEREAIRERRRREKKMKRERDRRERKQMQDTILLMAQEIKNLKDGHSEVDKKFQGLTTAQIDGEISELGKIYNQAQAVMEAAIAEGDGKKFTQAKAISDKAWARYTFLEAQKQQRQSSSTTGDKQKESSRDSSSRDSDSSADAVSEGVSLGKDGKRYGIAFVNKHKSWYDPSGSNRESKIVLTIDADLYNEGYDPETKEYWDELEDRCKEHLPHRFKANGTKPKPKSIVGGSGNDNSPQGNSEKSLPKEFVQTLKAAGYWEDPVKRKAAVKNYYANKRGA